VEGIRDAGVHAGKRSRSGVLYNLGDPPGGDP